MSPLPKASVITNVNGQADITALKGSNHIEFQMLGYKKKIVSYDELANQNFILEVETTNLNLDEVVVSATRWRQNSSNIPSKIISVAPKEVAYKIHKLQLIYWEYQVKYLFRKVSRVEGAL